MKRTAGKRTTENFAVHFEEYFRVILAFLGVVLLWSWTDVWLRRVS